VAPRVFLAGNVVSNVNVVLAVAHARAPARARRPEAVVGSRHVSVVDSKTKLCLRAAWRVDQDEEEHDEEKRPRVHRGRRWGDDGAARARAGVNDTTRGTCV